MRNYLFTSESVTVGHPDKVCDQISDAILDAMIKDDPDSRVACETLVTTDLVVVAGEITSRSRVDIPQLVRETIRKTGYTDASIGFDYKTCEVFVRIGRQSLDIDRGVTAGEGLHKEQGAGDQGLMFGFACNETPSYMPLPISLAHTLTRQLAEVRENKQCPFLRPDGKSQVTVEYGRSGKPRRIHTIVLSTQHEKHVDHEFVTTQVKNKVIMPVLPKALVDQDLIIHVNPTGRFVTGGPGGDCGLTGRKIIVDTYGGMGRHGGGAFSGKDPSKVDRSASYMARYIAKNIVAANIAAVCEVQISYAIGVAEPISVLLDTKGTSNISESTLGETVRELFPLTPAGIIGHFDLKRPIYEQTAKNGHFGNDSFPWEKTDMAKPLRKRFLSRRQ